MTLRWTERAARDLIAIGQHIADDNPSAARAWVASYLPHHHVVDDGIVVLTVFEGHRLLGLMDPDEE